MANVYSVDEIEAMMLFELIQEKKKELQLERLKTFLKKKELDKKKVLLNNNESHLKELSAIRNERNDFLRDLQQSRNVTDLCNQLQKEKDATKEAVNKWNELHTEEKKLAEQKVHLKQQKEKVCKKVLDLTDEMRQMATDELEDLEADKVTNGSWPTSTPTW